MTHDYDSGPFLVQSLDKAHQKGDLLRYPNNQRRTLALIGLTVGVLLFRIALAYAMTVLHKMDRPGQPRTTVNSQLKADQQMWLMWAYKNHGETPD